MEIRRALQVFAEGYSFTRSYTHPYLWETLGPNAFRLFDATRKNPRDLRSEEFALFDLPPAEALALCMERSQGAFRFGYLVREGEPDREIRDAFKSLGCRLKVTEPLFVHDLTHLAPSEGPFPVSRVTTPEQAAAVAKAAGSRQALPEHLALDPPPIRQYAAYDGETPVGWVNSVATTHGAWCASMYVQEPYRRRGIARSLMRKMLADDRDAGVPANVLLATHTGAKLYAAVGYRQLGTLYVYTPPRR